jgi:predicted GIY-YIG superfamily endonuclease
MEQFNPMLVHAVVYVLELEHGCYYVGITFNFNHRMSQHFGGYGSKWTTLHKPVRLEEVILCGTKEIENATTLKYMKRHGADKVRGGNWCSMATPKVNFSESVDGGD